MFSNWPFFSMCSISNASSIVLYVCPASSMCWAYFEFCLFLLMAWICSLYRTLNVRPICPTYFNGHSLHINW
jgi:hypothetical protein